MKTTDREMANFISEHGDLSNLLTDLSREVSKNSLKWKGQPQKVREDAIANMNDRGLCNDYEGCLKYLNSTILAVKVVGSPLDKVNRRQY